MSLPSSRGRFAHADLATIFGAGDRWGKPPMVRDPRPGGGRRRTGWRGAPSIELAPDTRLAPRHATTPTDGRGRAGGGARRLRGVGLRRCELLESELDLELLERLEADDPGRLLAGPEERDRRDAHDVELAGERRVGVDIDLDDID